MPITPNSVIVNVWEIQSDDQAARALAGDLSFEEIRIDRQNRAREIVDSLFISKSKTGFEIASGNGVVANILGPQCAALDCNDISTSLLELARQECASTPNVRFHLINDFLDHLPSNDYDFGYSLNVFIHFNTFDMFHYLVDMEMVLKPSGLFFFDACTVGDQTIDKFREHAGLYRIRPASVRGLLCFNDPQVIIRVVREAGLEVVHGEPDHREGWMKFIVRKPF